MKNIGIVIPSMRKSVENTICNLEKQTIKPDYVLIVNNGNNNLTLPKVSFKIEVLSTSINLGTNPVWNMVFSDRFKDYKYVGFLGDDYVLNSCVLEVLLKSLHIKWDKPIGMSTATIFKNKILFSNCKQFESKREIQGRFVRGKGHMGACLMKKCFADCLPEIPDCFKIFFGDDWLGWWIDRLGYSIVETSCGILHAAKADLKFKLSYPKVIEEERKYWKSWLRGEIEL